jgi:large subunit ribosomal protein L21
MYAVVQTGGKQYMVQEGNNIFVEKLAFEKGQEVVLDNVLLLSDADKVTVGRPKVEGAKVIAEVVGQDRAPKVIIFKKRTKKNYKRMQGHRQYLTELKIKTIQVK